MSYIAKNGRLYTSGASEALTLLDDKFSVNKSYSKGDSCIYNDYLWKFTSDKPAGEWDNSVVEQCRIMDFVDDVNGRLTQYKVKEYTFEYTNVNELVGYDIDESNAFLDGSSYLDTGDFSLPIGFKNNTNDVQCFISYYQGVKRIEFSSSTKTGTVHAFVRYK